jgi:integrase/recombinase XerD
MRDSRTNQLTLSTIFEDDFILTSFEGFIIAKRAERRSKRTIEFYVERFRLFTEFCDAQAITRVRQLTPGIVRQWLLWMEDSGKKPGSIHAAFRTLRAFLYWWENEMEPDGWTNPIRGRVKAPKVSTKPLPGVSMDDIQKMIEVCNTDQAARDKAIILCLVDTGARRAEFCALNVADVDLLTGAISIQAGKGDKARMVYLGQRSRKALRRYFKSRGQLIADAPLFATVEGGRLSFNGLREIIRRRAIAAAITEPGLHNFRRTFAVEMLRNGVDLVTVSRLLGHSSLEMTRRYIGLIDDDLQEGHRKGSPVDNFGGGV